MGKTSFGQHLADLGLEHPSVFGPNPSVRQQQLLSPNYVWMELTTLPRNQPDLDRALALLILKAIFGKSMSQVCTVSALQPVPNLTHLNSHVSLACPALCRRVHSTICFI